MRGTPTILYTDEEPSFSTSYMKEYYEEEGIKQYITRNHAAFAERFIRTYKALLYKRIDIITNMNIVDPQWTAYNEQVLETYNEKLVHSSTKMAIADAMIDTNQLDVKAHMEPKAKHKGKYPPLNVDDSGKILRKKKVNEKERQSFWSPATHKVASISEHFGQQYYKVVGTDRDYIRGELLNI
jgi:hypothetical protein